MKNKIRINSLLLTLTLGLLSATLTSCSDDETITPTVTPMAETIELNRTNTFYDLTIPGDADWQAVQYPFWAVPMKESGIAGTALQLFVETNDHEADRTDTLTVATADGKRYLYELTQMGTLRDPDNGPILLEDDIKYPYGVGYSLNVLRSTETGKYPVVNATPFNFGKLLSALNVAGEQDAFFAEERYFSRTENVTGNSTSDIASQLAVNGNIEVGLDAFKLSVSGAYNSNTSSSTKCVYAMQEIQHIVASRYLRSALLVELANQGQPVFQETFQNYINALKANPNDMKVIKAIVNRYGTHIVTYASLGGELRVGMQMKVDETVKASDISGALNLSSKVVNGNGDAKLSNKETSIANHTTISLTTYGGTNTYALAPGASFEKFMNNLKDPTKMKNWVSGIQSGKKLAIIDIETIPIYDLMPSTAARDALRNYIVGDYQTQFYKSKGIDYTPSLFKITGYDVRSDKVGSATLTLKSINQTIVAERAIVKGLSETEFSTIIYSGVTGEVNRSVGFFVGSDTRRPAKVKFNGNGEVTSVEEFKAMSTGAVEELYIDTTGDVTLMPKGYSSLYQTVDMKMNE